MWLLPPVPAQGRALSPFVAEHSGILSSFKLFLELEPQVRDIIFKFYESKYASCLKMLDEMKVGDRNSCTETGLACASGH